MPIPTAIWEKIRELVATSDTVARSKAVEAIEYESRELEHIFALLVMGSLIGIPAPPAQVALELMPLMEEELSLMIDKIDTAENPLSDLFSVLDVN